MDFNFAEEKEERNHVGDTFFPFLIKSLLLLLLTDIKTRLGCALSHGFSNNSGNQEEN
jgi:hypothetical protein